MIGTAPGSSPSEPGGLDVCLVVPCYNEAARLNFQSFRNFLSDDTRCRFLFVDDGSKDNTAEALRSFAREQCERVSVLVQPLNKGKAEAVRCGILHSITNFQPRLVGFWDADLATPLPTVWRFLEVLCREQHLKMVFGSRVQLLGRHIERKALRHYLGRVFATAASSMLRLPVYDTQCGAKLFRVNDESASIFAKPFLSKWVFDVEIVARYIQREGGNAKRVEAMIYEYPLETWTDVAGSKLRATDFVRACVDMARIYLEYFA